MRKIIAGLLLLLMAGPVLAQVVEGDDAPLRFGRFEAEGAIHFGFLSFGGLNQLDKDFLDPESKPTGWVYDLRGVKLLAPLNRGKIIALSNNYRSQKTSPEFELIVSDRLAGPEDSLAVDQGRFAGEMVVVIAKTAQNITSKDAAGYIYGVACGLLEYSRSQLRQVAVGPYVVPGLSYDGLHLQVAVNGKVLRKIQTRKLKQKVGQLVAWLSRHVRLEAGDMIFTGAPGKLLSLNKGDVVEVSLEGVGSLKTSLAGKACSEPHGKTGLKLCSQIFP